MVWIAVGLLVLLLLVGAFFLVGRGLFSAGDEPDPTPPPEPATTEPEPSESEPDPERSEPEPDPEPSEPATDPSEPDSEPSPTPTDDDSSPSEQSTGSDLPPVVEADSLLAEGAEALGTVIEITASPLRYGEGEAFGVYFYRCIFSLHLHNLTDVAQEYEMGLQIPGFGDMQWESDEPRALEAGELSELVLGWEVDDADELGVTEDECQGDVELYTLSVDPG